MNKKILVLGTMYLDINCVNFPFDTALYAHRETVGNEYLLDLGGSALNFARMAALLGLEPIMVGKIGADAMGETLEKLVTKNKITPAFAVDEKVQTNLAIHYIHEDGSSIMSSCGSANQNIDYEGIFPVVKANVESASFFYVGGLFKLKKLLPDAPRLLKEVKKMNPNIKIILDHGRVNNVVTNEDKKTIHKLFSLVDIYLPSVDEFLDVWGSKKMSEAIENMKKTASPFTVVKQGEKGAVGLNDSNVVEVPAFHVTPLNTVGAGDSFNAGFIKAYSEDKPFQECIRYANATAALKISQHETPALKDIDLLANPQQ